MCIPFVFISQSNIRSIAYIALDCGDTGMPNGGGLLHAAPNNSLNMVKILF